MKSDFFGKIITANFATSKGKPKPFADKKMETNKTPQKSTRIEDIQPEGVAFFGSTNNFYFAPDNPVPERVEKFRIHGVAQQMSDGTFDFTAKPRTRTKSILIKKLAHGRLSATCDGGIQLWLRVNKTEGLDIAETISNEAQSAIGSLIKSSKK